MKNKKGYTLVEVMVVTGLMGIVSMLSGVMISNLQNMMFETSKQLMVDEVHAQLIFAISGPVGCFQTFGGIAYTGFGVAVPQIVDNFGNVRFATGGGPYNQNVSIASMTATNFVTGPNADVPSPYNGRFDLVVRYQYPMSNGVVRAVSRVTTIKTQSITNWVGGRLAYDPSVVNQAGCSSNAGIAFGFDTSAGSYMTRTTPNTKYGNLTINGNFEVQGITTITSNYIQVSDRRFKDDLQTPNVTWETLNSVKGYNFTWKSIQRKDSGFLAQEIEKQFPEIVNNNPSVGGYKSVKYASLVPILAQSSKNLLVQNRKMESDLKMLDKKLKKIEEKRERF